MGHDCRGGCCSCQETVDYPVSIVYYHEKCGRAGLLAGTAVRAKRGESGYGTLDSETLHICFIIILFDSAVICHDRYARTRIVEK